MQYGVYSDIWSLGLSLVEVATGGTPVSPATYAEHTHIGLTGSSYPVPLGFPAYPYRRFQTVFDQLQTIVHGDLPKLPGDLFSPEAVDFCARWYARPLVPRRCHRWATHPNPPLPLPLPPPSPSLPRPRPRPRPRLRPGPTPISLDKEYRNRPSYQVLLQHPFVTKYADVFVDMAAWAKDANIRHRLAKGTLKNVTLVPSPLAASGYVDETRTVVPPALSASFSSLTLAPTPSSATAAGTDSPA